VLEADHVLICRERRSPSAKVGVRARGGLALLLCLGPAIGRAAVIVVNDAGDAIHACATTGTGTCTLRDAITFANANANTGPDTIGFDIGSGLATIQPSTALPNVTDPVVIDGTTQPGFAGSPLIELDGQSLVGTVDGLTITAGGCTVRGSS
jgi:CSLREA domain-containing protein